MQVFEHFVVRHEEIERRLLEIRVRIYIMILRLRLHPSRIAVFVYTYVHNNNIMGLVFVEKSTLADVVVIL